MLTLYVSSLIAVFVVLILRFINKPEKRPLFGIYQEKNKCYWFKYALLVAALSVNKWLWRLKRAYAVEKGASGDGNIQVYTEDVALEQKYDLGSFPQAFDSVYFNGVSKTGDAVVCMLSRRRGNICEAYFCMKVDGVDYLSPRMPDTYLVQDPAEEGQYKVQGIHVENFSPMRTWKLSYDGDMKVKDTEKTVKVRASLTWGAKFDAFRFSYQLPPASVARDLAREAWSRDYFATYKKLKTTYYEQMGTMHGEIEIDGVVHKLEMSAFRDHVFGKVVDWRNYHRYVYHNIYLENGDCISVGAMSQPLVVSHFTVGHLCRKSDQLTLPISSCDFKLYQHGENKIPPLNYGFTFKAGRNRYTVQITVDSEVVGYVGERRDAKIHNCCVTAEVNGVPGKGFVQWLYNNENKS